ncbi:hypothetical protein NA78x_006094 [Anatilimnocola sp. NA78]|uniref:hypothetical protein n=1 Tax=Anatilimnocola sp. NA78 TaxID=3415683 RepID=UPI003CE4DF0D
MKRVDTFTPAKVAGTLMHSQAFFCADCGQSAQGKFCSNCGARIVVDHIPILNDDGTLVEVLPDWEQEVSYENILKFPDVRQTIQRHAKLAPQRISGEQFLAIADKLVPQAVSLEGVAAVAQIVFTRMGIKTDKQRDGQVAAPVGEAIVRTLCSLARRGRPIRNVTQAADGCVIEATQPSDVWSLAGSLLVTVRRQGSDAAAVSATATVTGQVFDWGKNTRCLDELFSDLAQRAA